MQKRIIYVSNIKKVTYLEMPSSYFPDENIEFKKLTINGHVKETAEVSQGILVKSSRGAYLLYASISDLESVFEIPQGQHFMTGLNTYGNLVLQKSREIVTDFAKRESISPALLDGSQASLTVLDSVIENRTIDDEFLDKNFLPMYLYLAEMVQKDYGGALKLFYDQDDDIWVPDFFDKDGRDTAMGIYLFEEFERNRKQKFAGLMQTAYAFFTGQIKL